MSELLLEVSEALGYSDPFKAEKFTTWLISEPGFQTSLAGDERWVKGKHREWRKVRRLATQNRLSAIRHVMVEEGLTKSSSSSYEIEKSLMNYRGEPSTLFYGLADGLEHSRHFRRPGVKAILRLLRQEAMSAQKEEPNV